MIDEIELPLSQMTPPQRRVARSTTRFNICCWGRQSGKTTFGSRKMVWKPMAGPQHGRYWFILQTYDACGVVFERMDRLLHKSPLLRKKPNYGELRFFFANGVDVAFKSGDKPQNLRVETLHGAIIDECRQQQKIIWTQVVMPMLARYNGWCDFYSTPAGFDWFHDLYDMAKKINPDNEWSTFHAPSTEAPWWTEKELIQARATMSEDEYAQEILAEFRDFTAGSVYTFAEERNVTPQCPFAIRNEKYSWHMPVHVGPDFNLDPMAWTMSQIRNDNAYCFDEVWIRNSNTQEASKVLVEKILKLGIKANPQVIVCGDATSKAGQRAAEGKSDYHILFAALKAAGITYKDATPDGNPNVVDRVNAVNAALKPAHGIPKLLLHPDAKHTIEDLKKCKRKPIGDGWKIDPGPDRLLGHAADGLGYTIFAFLPIQPINPVGQLHMARHIF